MKAFLKSAKAIWKFIQCDGFCVEVVFGEF
jgi:hypothetical protein